MHSFSPENKAVDAECTLSEKRADLDPTLPLIMARVTIASGHVEVSDWELLEALTGLR